MDRSRLKCFYIRYCWPWSKLQRHGVPSGCRGWSSSMQTYTHTHTSEAQDKERRKLDRLGRLPSYVAIGKAFVASCAARTSARAVPQRPCASVRGRERRVTSVRNLFLEACEVCCRESWRADIRVKNGVISLLNLRRRHFGSRCG